MFTSKSREQIRAGQVFSTLEDVSRTFVTVPTFPVEARCDNGLAKNECRYVE